MKKKIILVGVLLVLVALVFSGCGKKDEKKKKEVTIEYGKACSIEDEIELTVKGNKIVERLNPSNPTGLYTYFWAGDGKKMVDISTEIKNLKDEELNLKDLIQAKIYVGDKEYDVMYIIENTDGSNLQGNGLEKPLTDVTRRMHFAAKVEKELVEKEANIKLVIKANDNEYTYSFELVKDKEDVKSEGARVNLNYKGTTIKAEQLISVPETCEFSIIKCEFVEKVMPPNPTGFYRYLPASEGNVYVDLQVSVKNTKDEAVKQSELPGSVVLYCGEKSYSVQTVVEEDSGGTLNTATNLNNIEASETITYHLVAKVPAEVKDSKDELWFRITADGTRYIFKVK